MERECMEKINHYCQKHKFTLVYADVSMTGPSHDPVFTVAVKVNGKKYGTGTGKNKKEAKAIAAKKAWEMIEKQPESPSNTQAAELSTTQMTLLPVQSGDYVSQLNTYSQRTLQRVNYPNTRTGDAHAPVFSCRCIISGYVYGNGTGPSLAAAKQAAAKQAFEKLVEEGAITMGNGTSNSNSTFSDNSDFHQVSTQSDLDFFFFSSNSICFKDSAANLAEIMENMAVCEKPSPSQRDTPSSALKLRRKLAANFNNVRDKEEVKKMSDESLPGLDTNTSEGNESPYTVNKRNVREVKQLARLEHKNIVRYYNSWPGYDHVTSPASRQKSDKEIPCLFIQMELCEKGPLENWIEKNRRNRKYHEMAQTTFLQILEGVKYIHSKGLIHRDLKPQNIFVSDEDKIKIGDFGLVTSVTCDNLTENTGTKSYMAPEQLGDRYGTEVDIYALGLIWFEILSAFSGHEKEKLWSEVRDGELPESFTNRFPTEAPIIKKMLSRDPSRRYSASQILELLKSVDKDKPFRTHTQ
ncbi:interferon-induced, double-stranded RNA-activated protein kinase isoform X6 [Neopsephotus bourkii]|uniref:interferon-induced, double-stranded RNA-activated protein kinase isoform X6 n=1 Tax=Neopsephotus bourkii TaxID=309878 RepID=UPI002AA50D23|nr:interferon-induced, double-stranded RNA-activated protein kinase isoform X6 [Neopsephotus bourkii]